MIHAMLALPELPCDEHLSNPDHGDEVAEFYTVIEVMLRALHHHFYLYCCKPRRLFLE